MTGPALIINLFVKDREADGMTGISGLSVGDDRVENDMSAAPRANLTCSRQQISSYGVGP